MGIGDGVGHDWATELNWTEVYELHAFLVDIVYQVEKIPLYF